MKTPASTSSLRRAAVIPFQLDGAGIRAIEIDGAPWFVGKDIAEALGYADPTNAMKQHCRGVAKHHPILDALGRTQQARVISEPDLYRLIAKSQLPDADRFERWVFEEVLPTIRKTGMYGRQRMGAHEFRTRLPAIPQTMGEALRLAADLADQNAAQAAALTEQAPKVAAFQRIEDAEGAFGLREAAQVLQVPERKLIRYLDAEDWIYKMPGSRRWQGYAEKRKAGLVTHKTKRYERADGEWCEAEHVRITPKGIAKLAQHFSRPDDLFDAEASA